jgi:hypothetical protein
MRLPTSDGTISDVLMLDTAGDAIQTIRIIRNLDKLRHLQGARTRESPAP